MSGLKETPALGLVLLLAAGLRLYTLDLRPLWVDEAWTLSTVYWNDPRLSLTFDFLRFNPPRMTSVHLLLSLLNAHLLGTDPWSLRIPSVAFGVGAVYMTYRLGALWFSRWVGIAAALLSALNLEQIVRSQEMRQYPLFLLLSLSSTYLLAKALRGGAESRRICAAYGVVTVLLAYSHLLAVFVIGGQLLYVAATERAASLRLTGPLPRLCIFWFLMYAPALAAFVSNFDASRLNTGVSFDATAPNLLALYRRLFLNVGDATPVLALALGLGVLGAFAALRPRRSQAAGFFLVFLAVLPLGAWLLASWSPRVFTIPKSWIYSSPTLHLLAALGLASLPGRWTSPVLLLGLCTATVTPLVSYYRTHTNPGYDQAAAYVRGHAEQAPVFLRDGLRVFSYYYIDQYPRLGTAAWTSFVEQVPLRPITFGTRMPESRSIYLERLAPEVHWIGSAPLETLASLPTMPHIWTVDSVSSCADFRAGSKTFTLVDERPFARGVRACLFQFLR
jgi:4-amino-4-deoxy-L-arabinose transferase-like glycosyltransferase